MDNMGRVVARGLTEIFQQQVIVDNRPGANSIIGTDHVAKSPPDGYTWLLTTGSHTHNAALYSKLPYDTLNDFIGLQKDTALVGTLGVVEAFKQAQIDQSATFNGTPYLVAATLFVLITIPLARFTDWLIARDRKQHQAGRLA